VGGQAISESLEARNPKLEQYTMEILNLRERELVALGAAMGSNCVPCVEFHIAESRKAGIPDPAIRAAIDLSDKVRQVPARKTLQAALTLLGHVTDEDAGAVPKKGCGCDTIADTTSSRGSLGCRAA
jgi:4-carboxymuconolactone decarboxylase